jgi:hypothetical protein
MFITSFHPIHIFEYVYMTLKKLFSLFGLNHQTYLFEEFLTVHRQTAAAGCLVMDFLSLLATFHQTGFLQDVQVVGDRGLRDLEVPADFGDAHLPFGQKGQNLLSGLVGQGLKD